MTFDKRLKAFRKKHGISMEGMARELGVSYSTINRWEKGQQPTFLYLEAFERVEKKYEDKK